MSGKYPNQGEALIMQWIVGQEIPPGLKLRLYKNNKTPGDADTEADYTEADFVGYAEVSYQPFDFDITPGNPTTAVGIGVAFTATAGSQNQDIYGYYFVTDDTRNLLVSAEKFIAPVNINNNGDSVTVFPTLTGQSTA